MTGAKGYIARETAISATINAAISIAFFLAIFGFAEAAPVWGLGNFAFDFLPQSFAVSFFASLVPSLLTRKAILADRIGVQPGMVAGPAHLLLQSVIGGLAMMVLGAGICAVLLWLSGIQEIAPLAAFVIKVAYGAVLGALVTFFRLRTILG